MKIPNFCDIMDSEILVFQQNYDKDCKKIVWLPPKRTTLRIR